jgi:hypothetical protein
MFERISNRARTAAKLFATPFQVVWAGVTPVSLMLGLLGFLLKWQHLSHWHDYIHEYGVWGYVAAIVLIREAIRGGFHDILEMQRITKETPANALIAWGVILAHLAIIALLFRN